MIGLDRPSATICKTDAENFLKVLEECFDKPILLVLVYL